MIIRRLAIDPEAVAAVKRREIQIGRKTARRAKHYVAGTRAVAIGASASTIPPHQQVIKTVAIDITG